MLILVICALSVGALHALAPDHWLPFVMIAKAQKWSQRRLAVMVFFAGLAHVLSAFLIGLGGMALGVTFNQAVRFDSARANIFSYLLIGFGLAYMIYGIRKWKAAHAPEDNQSRSLVGWILMALLVFGPCEPLIPVLFLGSLHGGWHAVTLCALFSIATLGTMFIVSALAYRGLSLKNVPLLRNFSPVMAGGAIAAAGIIVRVLGL